MTESSQLVIHPYRWPPAPVSESGWICKVKVRIKGLKVDFVWGWKPPNWVYSPSYLKIFESSWKMHESKWKFSFKKSRWKCLDRVESFHQNGAQKFASQVLIFWIEWNVFFLNPVEEEGWKRDARALRIVVLKDINLQKLISIWLWFLISLYAFVILPPFFKISF